MCVSILLSRIKGIFKILSYREEKVWKPWAVVSQRLYFRSHHRRPTFGFWCHRAPSAEVWKDVLFPYFFAKSNVFYLNCVPSPNVWLKISNFVLFIYCICMTYWHYVITKISFSTACEKRQIKTNTSLFTCWQFKINIIDWIKYQNLTPNAVGFEPLVSKTWASFSWLERDEGCKC